MLGFGDFIVGIALRYTSNGVRMMLADESAAFRANRALGTYEKRIASVSAAQQKAGTMFAGGVAAAGAIAIGAGIAQAAKFQLAMTGVGLALRASSSQLQSLQQTALQVSDITAQSATTIAQEMGVAATAGLNTLGIGRFQQLFPLLAKFADVQYFMAKSRGQSFSPTEAISYGVQFAHMFQAFTPDRMQTMLEWITKLTTVTAESPQRALNQAKYFVPLGTALGVSMQELFPLIAIMGQTGFLRGRGGTSIGRILLGAINATTLTSHTQSKQERALKALGIIDAQGRNTVLTAQGTLDWTKLTGILAGDAAKMKPATYAGYLQAGFGTVATQFGAVLNTPAVQKQLDRVRRMMEGLGNDPIGVFFDKIMNDFLPVFQKFVTNFVNLGINLFLPILPQLTTVFASLATTFGNWGTWLGAHPGAAKTIADLLIALTGLAALRFAAGGIGMLANAFGLLRGTAAGVGLFTNALVVLDNFAFMGLGQKLVMVGLRLGGVDTAALGAAGSLRLLLAALSPLAAAAAGAAAGFGVADYEAKHSGGMPMLYGGLGMAAISALIQAGVLPKDFLTGGHAQTHPGAISSRLIPDSILRNMLNTRSGTMRVELNVHLPKDTDAGNARRIVQHVKRLAGQYHTSSLWSINPGVAALGTY